MNVNNYECPRCHNVFPLENKFLHDNRCTESNPVPLNQSRLVGINSNLKENKNREPIQHRPQPKIATKRKIDSHINPLNVKESIMEIPQTFNCWLCGQTLPEKEKEDHMLCHKMQEENDNFQKNQKKIKNQQISQNQRPPQRFQQQRPPERPQQQRPPQRPQHQKQLQSNKVYNNNIKRSFVRFDDIDIFDFNQLHESLNKMDNPTDEDILSQLPETEIGDISKLPPEKRNCIICLIDLKTGDKATMLPCAHMFHSLCVIGWLKNKNFCPVCKFKLTKEYLNI